MSASGSEDCPDIDSLCRLQRLVCRHAEAVTELAAELTSAHADIVKAAAAGAPLVPLTDTGSSTKCERSRQAARPESVMADPAPTKACSSEMAEGFQLPAVPHDATECGGDVDGLLESTSDPVQEYGTNAPHPGEDILGSPPEAAGGPVEKCGTQATLHTQASLHPTTRATINWSKVRLAVRTRSWSRSRLDEAERAPSSGGIFADPEALKEAIRRTLTEAPFDLTSCYHRTGCSQSVARSRAFEAASLAMVCLSSLWMGVEIEFDDSVGLFDAHPVFQVMAQLFCVFFVAEISVRFLAFRNKLDVRKDPWFLFDAALVVLVVFETWVMSTAVALMNVDSSATENLKVLAVFRTFRVFRVLRLARILRQLSELMVIVRGIAIAFRGIAAIMGLLSFVIYLGAIVFRVLLDGTGVGRDHFQSIPAAMGTLLLELTLSGGRGTAIIRQAYGDHPAYAFLLLVFVTFSGVTVMGVLSGLLVQTVKAVAEIEKEEKAVKGMQGRMNDLWDLITRHDKNHDGMISMEELQAILLDKDSARVLQRMGVDMDGLGGIASFVFEEHDGALTKGQFKRMLLDLRSGQAAKVKDHVETRKYVSAQFKKGGRSRQNTLASATASATPSRLRDLGKAHAWVDVLALTAPGPQRSMQRQYT